jgi:hypothetical protein
MTASQAVALGPRWSSRSHLSWEGARRPTTSCRDRVDYETATDFDGDIAVRPISRRDIRVDGRRAAAAELETTGQGMYPAGQRQYVYYVEDDPFTVMAMTHDIPGAAPPSYEERQRILEQMIRDLRFMNAR